MTPKEKALELYTKFTVYYWHEVDGYLPGHDATLKISINVVIEIREVIMDILGHGDDYLFWGKVIEELRKI